MRDSTHKRCIKAYKRQLSRGGHFLHEHLEHASSWCMPEMCKVPCVAGDIAGERTCWRKSSSAVDWAERDNCGSDVLTHQDL